MSLCVRSCLLGLACASLPSTAWACEDAGPLNYECDEGGGAWISCSVHAECPSGQVCHHTGTCVCTCSYGETCTAAGCRCAPQEVPTPPAGCEVYDLCGTYYVECPRDAGAPPPAVASACPDGGGDRRPCTTDSDCSPFEGFDGTWACGANGFCACSAPVETGGCTIASGARGFPLVLVTAIGVVLLAARRR
jgi:hypothetical protein